MKNKFLSVLAFTLVLISCNENKIYDKLDKDFSESRWQKSDAKSFEFEIDQASRNYDVNVHFAYLSDFQVNPVPLTVAILHPDGTEEKREIKLIVKDANGKETGDCGGDYCDIWENIFKNEALKKGSYKITIQQNYNGPYLPNVNGIGIEVIAAAD